MIIHQFLSSAACTQPSPAEQGLVLQLPPVRSHRGPLSSLHCRHQTAEGSVPSCPLLAAASFPAPPCAHGAEA